MFVIDDAARRAAVVAVTAAQMLWSKRSLPGAAFSGVLAGAGLTVQIHEWSISWLNLCVSSAGLREVSRPQPDLVLAFTLYPVTASARQIAVLTAALAALILLWSRRTTSTSFFLGALAGVGFVLSFDIVWVHWIFGLHHLTNTQMDLVLEPVFVLLGLAFLWFAITQERRQRFSA